MRITYTNDAGNRKSINVKRLEKVWPTYEQVIVPVNSRRRWVLSGDTIISREGRKPRIIGTSAQIEN